jgi:hypothetical protein
VTEARAPLEPMMPTKLVAATAAAGASTDASTTPITTQAAAGSYRNLDISFSFVTRLAGQH